MKILNLPVMFTLLLLFGCTNIRPLNVPSEATQFDVGFSLPKGMIPCDLNTATVSDIWIKTDKVPKNTRPLT